MDGVNASAPHPQNDPEELLNAARVRALCGGCSDMSIWRWTRDLGFPQADVVINRRRLWKRGSVTAWLAARTKNAA